MLTSGECIRSFAHREVVWCCLFKWKKENWNCKHQTKSLLSCPKQQQEYSEGLILLSFCCEISRESGQKGGREERWERGFCRLWVQLSSVRLGAGLYSQRFPHKGDTKNYEYENNLNPIKRVSQLSDAEFQKQISYVWWGKMFRQNGASSHHRRVFLESVPKSSSCES